MTDEHGLSSWTARADPVDVAVVGLGYWGPNLVRNLAQLPDARVVAVSDLSRDRIHSVQANHPSIRAGLTFESILSDPSIEAVVIATSVSTHYRLALAALEAGKHVFVEKPLAASLDEARRLSTCAARRNLVLMPGHTFLYSPPVRAIRSMLAAGDLGEIHYISMSRVNLGVHQSDASVIWDLGPHDFSILLYWLPGCPVSVSCHSRACIIAGTPDVAFLTLHYDSGIIVHVELSWLAPSKLRRTAVVGSRRMIVYDDTSVEPVRVFDSGVDLPSPTSFGEHRLTYRTGDIVSPRIDGTEPIQLEMQDFCRCIRSGEQPVSSSEVGVNVVAIAEAADSSSRAHGAPMPIWPSTDRREFGSTVTL